ncbi:CDP-alcohol phosphatidyltransferase family protein [Helicovermis profundi]|uniref:CDP-alcohol phosphatidyltransferase family protein n=1 Tax=Helicovermis profundi TaxID=3065157 RepID=A0AAU9E5R6_9FIRM|nr:CDP-alcohol phosphatidyltransferase family protein [Clostridia bacterium S502]
MLDTKARKYFQPFFNTIAKVFIRLKISANKITILAFITGVSVGIAIYFDQRMLSVALLWVSGLLDAIDGSLARITNTSSKLGAYMDLIMDRMVEAAVILGFAIRFPNHYISYILFLILVIFNFSTFMVAGALFQNEGEKSMHYDSGLAERTETFIVFTLMIIFSNYIFYVLNVFNLLILFTGIMRFYFIVKNSNKV